MNKGTILYVGGFELPDKNAAACRVMNNAKIMRDIGYRVVLVGVSADCDSSIENTKTVHDGFDCWAIRFNTQRERFKKQMDISLCMPVLEKYQDVVAIVPYNYPAVGLYRFKRYCKKNSIALIADCTEWYPAPRTNIIVKTLKWAEIQARMAVLQKRIDGVICISRYLEDYYKNHTKVVYVPALVDSHDQQWKDKKTSTDACVHFVYSGNPGFQKDKINKIMESLYALREQDFLFRIIGITKEEYLQYYSEHTGIMADLADKVKFGGKVSHQTALDYVKSADFTIFFRDHSRLNMAGFPTKFVESISAKTPVITNMTSNLSDYLVDGVNGFFVENHQDITNTLEMVLSMDREEIAKMRENCDEELFDYRNYIVSVEDFLGDILHGKQ